MVIATCEPYTVSHQPPYPYLYTFKNIDDFGGRPTALT